MGLTIRAKMIGGFDPFLVYDDVEKTSTRRRSRISSVVIEKNIKIKKSTDI